MTATFVPEGLFRFIRETMTPSDYFRKFYQGEWKTTMEKLIPVASEDLRPGDVVRLEPDYNNYGNLLVLGKSRDLTASHLNCEDDCLMAVQTGDAEERVEAGIRDKAGNLQPWVNLNGFTDQVKVEEVREERVYPKDLKLGDRIRMPGSGTEGIYLGKAQDLFHPDSRMHPVWSRLDRFPIPDHHVMDATSDDFQEDHYMDKAGEIRNWFTFGSDVIRLEPFSDEE